VRREKPSDFYVKAVSYEVAVAVGRAAVDKLRKKAGKEEK